MEQRRRYYMAALIALCAIAIYLSPPVSLKRELRAFYYATFYCEYSRILNNIESFSKRTGKENIERNRIMMLEEYYLPSEINKMEQNAKHKATTSHFAKMKEDADRMSLDDLVSHDFSLFYK